MQGQAGVSKCTLTMDRTQNKAKPMRERTYKVKIKNPKMSKALLLISFGVFILIVIIMSVFLS